MKNNFMQLRSVFGSHGLVVLVFKKLYGDTICSTNRSLVAQGFLLNDLNPSAE